MNRELEQLLEQAALGELDPAARIRLETLYASNPELAQRVQREQRVTELLRHYGPNHAPAGLARSVFAQLDNPKEIKAKAAGRTWWTNPLLGWAACAAVVAVVMTRPLWDADRPKSSLQHSNFTQNVDGRADKQIASASSNPPPSASEAPGRELGTLSSTQYDPSNATTSNGDVYRAADERPVDRISGDLPASAEVDADDSVAKPSGSKLAGDRARDGELETKTDSTELAFASKAANGPVAVPEASPNAPEATAANSAAARQYFRHNEKLGEHADERALGRAMSPAEIAKARLRHDFDSQAPAASPADAAANAAANAAAEPALASAVLAGASGLPPATVDLPQPRVGLRITLAGRPLILRRVGPTTRTSILHGGEPRQASSDATSAVRHALSESIEPPSDVEPPLSQKDIEIAVLMADGKIVKREGTPGPGKETRISVVMNPEQMRAFLKNLNQMGIRPGDPQNDKKKSTVRANVLSQQYEVVEGEAIYRMVEKGTPIVPPPPPAPHAGESLDLSGPVHSDGRIDLSLTIQPAND